MTNRLGSEYLRSFFRLPFPSPTSHFSSSKAQIRRVVNLGRRMILLFTSHAAVGIAAPGPAASASAAAFAVASYPVALPDAVAAAVVVAVSARMEETYNSSS